MGYAFTDKYSFLHFCTGAVVYYWNVSFATWFVLHLIFEYLENTAFGMYIINHFTMWPGGKSFTDAIINRVGDQVYAMLGWGASHVVCTYIF